MLERKCSKFHKNVGLSYNHKKLDLLSVICQAKLCNNRVIGNCKSMYNCHVFNYYKTRCSGATVHTTYKICGNDWRQRKYVFFRGSCIQNRKQHKPTRHHI